MKPWQDHGTGALCPEAQADGVPCDTIDRDCLDCARARPARRAGEGRPARAGPWTAGAGPARREVRNGDGRGPGRARG